MRIYRMKPLVTALLIASSFSATAASKYDLQQQFINGNPVCQGAYGSIKYRSVDTVQCVINKINGSRMIQASLNQYGEGKDLYTEVVISLDQSNGLFSNQQSQYLVSALKRGLKLLGKDQSIAAHFSDLPYSDDGNKPTIIEGVSFNIPDFDHSSLYGNYMLTVTK